ncbi:glycosyltransferase family 2 protein [Actinomadura sp. KC216]|uniref:glycosyltransferase family 2 protein n=1 Tax=Actinomadura sp. KC216 TaxID=2530370 RepID=UPI00104C0D67|nr:glycosyltransferase family 2 protein [Actinomadura sp. KC216]TDB91508.1 glycosyltransferase family 2 protein [Actinomadura sp. KC216]
MKQPLVSVITPVYNCRDTVVRALESAFAQTLPPERVEVIAVDDGSTDGSAELLDELARAHEQLTVIHQPNSGGAGAPRNRGLEQATGEFVFFLDADDALGPEALARMTAMAERNGTDIVLGKQVGTGGRKMPQVFGETVERTHVLEPGSDLFWRMSMAALQLFRRSLIEDAGLRFTEGIPTHEDQLFTAGAYLRARGVSILADYDCYYWAARADGSSITQLGGTRAADLYTIVTTAMEQAADFAEPGEIRDQLHRRYLDQEVFGRLQRKYLGAPEDERKVTYAACRDLLEKWLSPGLRRGLVPVRRVIAHCVLNDLCDELDTVLRFHNEAGRPRLHLEDGRCFQKYPFFRDASAGIPDDCYELAQPPTIQHRLSCPSWTDDVLRIGGTVVVRDTDEGTPDLHLILDGDDGPRRIPCETAPAEGTDQGMATTYTADLHPVSEGWPDGRWTVAVEASIAGHVQTIPVQKPGGMHVPTVLDTHPAEGARLVRVLPVRGRGDLGLELGGGPVPGDLPDAEASLSSGNRLRVRIEAPPVLGPGPAPAMSVVLRHAGDENAAIRAVLEPDGPSHLQADLSLARARGGRWKAFFEIGGIGDPVRTRLREGAGVLGPVTASWAPPRRVHVRLDEKWLTASVTDPVRQRAASLRRRLIRKPR